MRSSDAPGDGSALDQAELGLDARTRVSNFFFAERWTWASFLVHGAGLFCMALLPPQSSALALDMLNDDAHYARYLATPIERTPIEPFAFGEGEDAPSDAKAADSEGQAGKSDAPHKPRRMSGGSKSQATLDPRESARQAGILGVLDSVALRASGPGNFDVQGAGDGARAAMGAIFGSEPGDSFGFNGLGIKHSGRGGGGDALGSVGVGKLLTGEHGTGCPGCVPTLSGPRHDARVPRLRPGGSVEVQGSLSKEVIRRVIQRRLNEVRFCYEEGLRSLPELAGRVAVKFVISPSGAVQGASVAANELTGGGAQTAQCIANAVRRWSFPAPDGGGVVIVEYPFVLQSGM